MFAAREEEGGVCGYSKVGGTPISKYKDTGEDLTVGGRHSDNAVGQLDAALEHFDGLPLHTHKPLPCASVAERKGVRNGYCSL